MRYDLLWTRCMLLCICALMLQVLKNCSSILVEYSQWIVTGCACLEKIVCSVGGILEISKLGICQDMLLIHKDLSCVDRYCLVKTGCGAAARMVQVLVGAPHPGASVQSDFFWERSGNARLLQQMHAGIQSASNSVSFSQLWHQWSYTCLGFCLFVCFSFFGVLRQVA